MLVSIFYKSASTIFWIILGLQTLLWPHIAYYIGKTSKNQKRTEFINMGFEAFACGIWMVAVDFSLWPTTALFVGALVNTLGSGGVRLFIISTFLLLLGVGTGIGILEFTFQPNSSLVSAAASIAFIVLYSIIVSIISYIYSKQVSKTNAEIKQSHDELSKAKDEIQAAYEELESMNGQLIKTRDQLWGEMQLAKKIQTILLPQKPEINGYEIAAYMQPADEVGGDYYDIINVGDKNWIVIGDVSGHGVPAGLVMMMVQTSIHTVLQDAEDLKPSILLSRVNTVIADNIRRLNEDKYMTITVFACLEKGQMHFSGLHQDIMIYKAQEKNVELVETNGTWIGILDDISDMNDDFMLTLEINDIMLVFTDGLTEAWHKDSSINNRNFKIDMYGPEKLNQLLLENGEKNPQEIIQKILQSLNNYTCSDDVTLLIVKRMQ